MIDTGVRHKHAASGYADRRRECAEAAQLGWRPDLARVAIWVASLCSGWDEGVLGRRAKHVFTENARVRRAVACAGRPRRIGPLLTASHVSLRDDFEVSSPELDVAVEAALEAGALGARMTGGGFGGSALALRERTTCAVRLVGGGAFGRRDWLRRRFSA